MQRREFQFRLIHPTAIAFLYSPVGTRCAVSFLPLKFIGGFPVLARSGYDAYYRLWQHPVLFLRVVPAPNVAVQSARLNRRKVGTRRTVSLRVNVKKWNVNLNDGYVYYDNKINTNYVWPVRAGE